MTINIKNFSFNEPGNVREGERSYRTLLLGQLIKELNSYIQMGLAVTKHKETMSGNEAMHWGAEIIDRVGVVEWLKSIPGKHCPNVTPGYELDRDDMLEQLAVFLKVFKQMRDDAPGVDGEPEGE